MSRTNALTQYPKLPLREYNIEKDELNSFFPKSFAAYILTLPAKTFKANTVMLGAEIVKLAKSMDFDILVFLGDVDIPWLSRSHEYKFAREGLEYLISQKVGKKFNGAFKVNLLELPTFIKHLAWMVRTNAIVPYVYFIDPKQNLIGTICQYGNIHISVLNQKTVKPLRQFIDVSKFQYVTSETCVDKFSKKSNQGLKIS